MNRLTLSTALAAILLLFLVAGCVVQIRPDGGIRIDLPPFIQPTPPAAGAPVMTPVTMTATASITNTPVITGTVPPTPSLTTTATATLIATAPTAATATATATVTTTATVTATMTITGTPPATPTGTVTVTSTATPTTGTPTTGTPPTGTPPTGTPTRTPTMTPQPGTRTAVPTGGVTPSPTVTATRTVTPAPTRTVTGTPTGVPTPTSATPPATATPIPSTVFLGSHQGYEADSAFYVVGEVINGGSFPVFNVKVIGSFYDASGNLVGAQESVTDLVQIEPELSSPFKLQVANSGGNISRYELTLIWDDISIVDYEELTILSQETREEGQLEVFGELRNDGSVSVKEIVVVVTFYDSSGIVADVYRGTVAQPILAPDATTSYSIPIPRSDLEYDHFTVQAQGSLQLF